MQRILILIGALAVLVRVGQAKDQPQLTVEVLKAETTHWSTYWDDTGSAGRTATDCDEDSALCRSITGARPGATKEIYHTQVDLLVKMPDGRTVEMQCHYPPIWASCFQPEPGIYAATIKGHNIHLQIPVTAKPKYNKDGTLKKPAKSEPQEVKFSFR